MLVIVVFLVLSFELYRRHGFEHPPSSLLFFVGIALIFSLCYCLQSEKPNQISDDAIRKLYLEKAVEKPRERPPHPESFADPYNQEVIRRSESPQPIYQEPLAGKQYHGGYGSTQKKEIHREPITDPPFSSSQAIQGAPTTSAPSCAMSHDPVGFGEGVPMSTCSAKRGGKPFYMFGVGQ